VESNHYIKFVDFLRNKSIPVIEEQIVYGGQKPPATHLPGKPARLLNSERIPCGGGEKIT